MATTDRPKYMWIPPPPLPEFYLPKEQLENKEEPSSTSSSGTDAEDDVVVNKQRRAVKVTFKKKESEGEEKPKQQPPVTGDGAYDGLPPPYRYVGVPPWPSQAAANNSVPPLAVYHICRICLKPRSARYHREHPIPIDGVPPPPGICRRCRVTSVKESSEIDISDVDEVVKKGRSNDIKIGCIRPFVPEEAIISNEEAKRMQAQRYLRGRSRERHVTIFREASSESQRRYRRSRSRRRDIVYRHVRVMEDPEPAPKHAAAEVSTAERTTRKTNNEPRTRVQYERVEESTATRAEPAKESPSMSRVSLKSANLARVDSTKASQSSQVTSSTSSQCAAPTAKAATETVILKRPERTDSEIRKLAGEEARRYANDLRRSVRPESDIRRIAHEEVARYREAERKLEARPGAFAHGRLVPVRRQIEKDQDQTPPMPWKEPSKIASAVTVERRETSQEAERARSAKSTSYRTSNSRTSSNRESWGSQWRRELSLERRRSNETGEEKWAVEVNEERRSRVSAPPSDLRRSDKPRSTCDVARDADASARTSKDESQLVSDTRQVQKPTDSRKHAGDADMGLPFPPAGRHEHQNGVDREREMIERLSVRDPASAFRPTASGKPKICQEWDETDVMRSTTSRSTKRWETSGSGGTQRDSVHSTGKPGEHGTEKSTAVVVEKQQCRNAGTASASPKSKPSGPRQASDVQYEYKLHTVRPAKAKDMGPLRGASVSLERSGSSGDVTMEIWQQVPTDPVQRARDAPLQERERKEAIEWLKRRMDDPTAQVGIDADGSRRLACSIPYSGSSRVQEKTPPRLRRPSPRQSARPRERSPRRETASHPQRSSGPRGGGKDDAWPDREMVVDVWEQVPAAEAKRYRRQSPKEYVIKAWKQEPRKERPASSARRDSAVDTPPARRRRERREHHHKASDDSTHVKFASKVEISPTPPGSEDSSNAFRRFHDFVGRKTTRQQIDGHDSEERGEDIIAEYERRGRLRSREPAPRKNDYGYGSRDAKDRDSTVRPREGQRRYDGRRDEAWRPLQRALSESPSRERDDRKRSSTRSGGPPYHPVEKPTGSMTTRDGSRSNGRWW